MTTTTDNLGLTLTTVNDQTMHIDQAGFPMEACFRCGGYGRYMHNGDTDACYDCAYHGLPSWHRATNETTPAAAQTAYAKTLKTRAQARARYAAKVAAKAAKKEAAHQAEILVLNEMFNTHPAAVDATYYTNLEAAGAPAWQIRGYEFAYERWNTARGLTDKVLTIAEEVTNRIVAAATKTVVNVPDTTGRIQVTGRVLAVKETFSYFGYRETATMKMTVETTDGYRLYGTIPNTLWVDGFTTWDDLKGRTVTFTARIERSDNDPAFGFFSRPTKATTAPVVE